MNCFMELFYKQGDILMKYVVMVALFALSLLQPAQACLTSPDCARGAQCQNHRCVGPMAFMGGACNDRVGAGEFLIAYSCATSPNCSYGFNFDAWGSNFYLAEEAALNYFSRRPGNGCSRSYCQYRGQTAPCP